MTPVIPCSFSSVPLVPRTAFSTNKCNSPTIFNLSRRSVKHRLPLWRLTLPFASVRVLPQYRTIDSFHRNSVTHVVSATEIDVAVDEKIPSIADEDSSESSGTHDAVEETEESSPNSDASPAPAKARSSRTGRKSDMPPVKNEELIPGATFAGKIKSIQPFGAFVDFGAFTDGLVHISRLSDSYVKDVNSVVSVGQEVKVKLIEVNTDTQRISLSMRESDDASKRQQPKDAATSTDKAGSGRRNNTSRPRQKKEEAKKSTKFVKGQMLEGTVKNLTRSGAFISLPDGEEGFLPTSEEYDEDFANIMGTSSLQVAQEVSVRVLRITRGQVTLTMKKEEEQQLDSQLSQGVVHSATNPFVLAFRKNKDIAAFLDEREKVQQAVEPAVPKDSVETTGDVKEVEAGLSVPEVQDQVAWIEETDDVPSAIDKTVQVDEISEKEVGAEENTIDGTSTKIVGDEDSSKSVRTVFTSTVAGNMEEEAGTSSESLVSEEDVSSINRLTEEVPPTDDIGSAEKSNSYVEIENETLLPESHIVENVTESEAGDIITEEEKQLESSNTEKETTAASSEVKNLEADPDKNGSITTQVVQLDVLPYPETADKKADNDQVLSPPSHTAEVEGNLVNDTQEDLQSSAANNDISSASLVGDEVGDVPMNNSNDTNSYGQMGITSSEGSMGEDKKEDDDQVLSPPSHTTEVEGNLVNDTQEDLQSGTANNEISSASLVGDEVGDVPMSNGNDMNSNGQAGITSSEGSMSKDESESDDPVMSPESHFTEVADSSVVNPKEEQIESSAAGSSSSASPVEDDKMGDVPDCCIPNQTGQNASASSQQGSTEGVISPSLVKQLREETGAGMMDCKKALAETGGDIVKAQELLRKKGLASAEKKASRTTAEGRIGSYIHDSRIGVLIEVNCETDFVSRGDIFKELVDDLAMQVAACPQVKYLVTEDVPEDIVNREREIEMQKEDLLSKPEQIRSKIVDGRIRKRLEELALLEQPYIKNDKSVVKDWVKQTIATIGENIKVKRFVRFNLGEGLEKKSQDFAAEVAAQTAAKPNPSPSKTQPDAVEAKETAQKSSTATISAALVKQLREDTGAGMMDCKKALSETGGDLEKAQEYLRKKGLSAADKKSSRLAAEGRIGSYIHDSRIGVLIEVNCETDFVGRSEKFKELVDDLAMQVVACPQVQFVSVEEIPESMVDKEKELEMQREDILSKPENIRERIVDGRVSKRLGELALLEQPFIKDDNVLVKDLVKQTVAALGENVKVRRFVRFTLGETIENEKPELAC